MKLTGALTCGRYIDPQRNNEKLRELKKIKIKGEGVLSGLQVSLYFLQREDYFQKSHIQRYLGGMVDINAIIKDLKMQE